MGWVRERIEAAEAFRAVLSEQPTPGRSERSWWDAYLPAWAGPESRRSWDTYGILASRYARVDGGCGTCRTRRGPGCRVGWADAPRAVDASREIDDILQRAADGGRITPDEALLLYTDAPAARARPGGRRGPPPPLPGQHRHVHHRPQHQLHQRLRDGVQVLRLLPRAQARRGLDARPRRDPAPLRRGRRARRHPDHAAGRPPPGARHRVVRGARSPRSRRTYPQLVHPLASARPRSCTWPGSPGSTVEEAITRLHAAGLDSFAGAGAEILRRRGRAPRSPR